MLKKNSSYIKFLLVCSVIIWALIFILGLITPLSYLDDSNYAVAPGSILSAQIVEYSTLHGRFLTHLIARFILRYRYTADFLMALIGTGYLLMMWVFVNPVYSEEVKNRQRVLVIVLWTVLILFFIQGLWFPMIQVMHFMSYRFSLLLIAVFLLPYLKFFGGEHYSTPSIYYIASTAFLSGATHEQAVVVPPILILTAFYLIWKKIKIPSWFWIGIYIFVLGNLTVLLAPSTFSEERLIGYGEALQWDFFGSTFNWFELGWKRYLYNLIKLLIVWVPYSFFFVVFYIVMLKKCLKKTSILSTDLLPSIFLMLLGQSFVFVMIVSPRVESQALAIGGDLVLISCISMLSLYWKLTDHVLSKVKKYFYGVCLAAIFISWNIQILVATSYRIAYNEKLKQIDDAYKKGETSVTINKFKNYGIATPFGNIRIIYPPWDLLPKMLLYHGYSNISITEVE